jgi:hypothetical protein
LILKKEDFCFLSTENDKIYQEKVMPSTYSVSPSFLLNWDEQSFFFVSLQKKEAIFNPS